MKKYTFSLILAFCFPPFSRSVYLFVVHILPLCEDFINTITIQKVQPLFVYILPSYSLKVIVSLANFCNVGVLCLFVFRIGTFFFLAVHTDTFAIKHTLNSTVF